MQQTFCKDLVYDPLYRHEVKALAPELELFQSKTLRRLKFLSHYGTASLYSSIMHSRLDHTIGVWSLIARFFPHEEELRLAALLHDIGHLPFSHAVEKTLGFNHHANTEQMIRSGEVHTILQKYGYDGERIITLLNTDTPLTNKTKFLGTDHFDSFLRDAYLVGSVTKKPSELLQNIRFSGNYVETDVETGLHILDAMVADHVAFLNPLAIAIDGLLAQAVLAYSAYHGVELSFIEPLTNYELLYHLQTSECPYVRELVKVILWEPQRIAITEEARAGAMQIDVKKIYDKEVLVDGISIVAHTAEAQQRLEQVRALKKTYYISYETEKRP